MAIIDETGAVPAVALNAPTEQRTNIAQQALDAFDEDVRGFARQISQGTIRGRDWHSQMLVRLRQHFLQQAQLGKGGPLTPVELDRMQDAMTEQARYLKRFADEVSVRNELAENAEEVARRRLEREGREVTQEAVDDLADELRGRAMTEDEIAARARQYKGRAYEEYYRQVEGQLDAPSGVVIDYEAVDDGATCGPCAQAERNGPYLPGQGPYPGTVCLGGGHCRCVRRPRQASPEAARLRGE
jgi:hypothetical protein